MHDNIDLLFPVTEEQRETIEWLYAIVRAFDERNYAHFVNFMPPANQICLGSDLHKCLNIIATFFEPNNPLCANIYQAMLKEATNDPGEDVGDLIKGFYTTPSYFGTNDDDSKKFSRERMQRFTSDEMNYLKKLTAYGLSKFTQVKNGYLLRWRRWCKAMVAFAAVDDILADNYSYLSSEQNWDLFFPLWRAHTVGSSQLVQLIDGSKSIFRANFPDTDDNEYGF